MNHTNPRLRRCAVAALGIIAIPLSGGSAAATFTATGTGVNGAQLEAQAIFDVTATDLTIRLTNIATNDQDLGGQDTPGNTLTGLFFDITGDPVLATVSATVPFGSSIIQASQCDQAVCTGETDVSGEWGFSQTQDFAATGGPSATYGIASAGYLTTGLAMNVGNFNNGGAGTNLDAPTSLDGINFGIVSGADATFSPNSGLASEPLIMDSVVFVLDGDFSGLTMDDIANVSFQYGTGFDEPNIVVPVPAALWLFGSGLLGLAGFARRRSC